LGDLSPPVGLGLTPGFRVCGPALRIFSLTTQPRPLLVGLTRQTSLRLFGLAAHPVAFGFGGDRSPRPPRPSARRATQPRQRSARAKRNGRASRTNNASSRRSVPRSASG
ncbi:MAG TPA: hypothetical protein VM791_01880, partial [Vicinamibacterales bacterium]|nr:hypothetical protein [Vicinamibacterales bacterium]